VASLSRSLAPPVLGAGTPAPPIEAGSDLGPPTASRSRSRTSTGARAREVCTDIAEELVQLAALTGGTRLTPARPEIKTLLAELRADAGELLLHAARLAGTASSLGDTLPRGQATLLDGIRRLQRVVALLDGQLADAPLTGDGSSSAVLALAAQLLAGLDATGRAAAEGGS
jgi:hypothetical protein